MNQIVALTALVHEMHGTIKSNPITLVKKAEEQATAQPTKNNLRPQKVPYTVDVCQLVNKEDTVTVDEKNWYWCTKDHYSGGLVHNGMYALHKTYKHDTLRKYLDERKAKAGLTNPKSSATPSTTPNLKPVKKLALSESLCTSLCTQAGLSSDAADCIWYDACTASGN